MRIQTRFMIAVILVITIATIAYSVYSLRTERAHALARLRTVIAENDRLLMVVTAGPLYDGNVEQLNSTLDSFFTNLDMVQIDLSEYNGNIRLSRSRTPAAEGTPITSRVVIMGGIDELGEITVTYSTARLEQSLRVARNQIIMFSIALVLGLSAIIYIVVKGLTRPIERLTVAARDMASGHLDREIDTRGAEELQSLGQSFIRMRDAIREKMEDLAAQNEALKLKDQAIASSIEGITIADPAGIITYVNTAFLRLWGYSQETEVLGRSAMDFWSDREEAAKVMQMVVAQEGSIGELLARRRDGSTFPVEYSASLVKNTSGTVTHLMGSFVDITDRKRAENQLRSAHDLLQAVLNTIPARVFWKDRDLRYLGCNRPFALDAGVNSPEEVIGKDDYQMGWRAQAALYRSDDRRVLETGTSKIHYEEPQTTPDGRHIWLRSSKVPLKNADGTIWGVLGTYEDITEYKQAEESLRQAALIVENSPAMLFRWKAVEGWPMVLVSQNVVQLGYTPEELLDGSVPFASIVHPDDAERVAREVQAYTASGVERFQQEYRLVTKDGHVRWIDDHTMVERDDTGRVTHYQGIVVDITERKRIEQALQYEKAFSDTVIDSLPGVFYICDDQGLLLRWNDNETVVTGYSKHELSEMNLLKLFPYDRELMEAHLHEVLESGKATVEASIATRSGAAIPFYLTGFRMVADGKRYLVGVGIDISERKRLEQQLFHAQKMESIGQLAGGIAHDFNNILAAIVGYGSILLMKMRNDDRSREYVNHILTSAERAASLTQSLLAFSRKQVINPRNIDLNESIQKIEKFLARIIGEDITFTTALDATALIINADITQIEQILMNLATNARDAMPKGGRLMIETGRVVLDEEYIRTKGYGIPGSYAELTVSDTGEGMDEATQKNIFDPFFTTKELGKGTGLGLAIVYGIVKQNNGYVHVYSEVDKGTTFKIYLPLVSAPIEEGWRPKIEQPLQGGKETILFAEDNEALRHLNSGVLQEFGYTVIEAADGEEALQKFREHADRISLVILDVIMPQRSGRDVFEEVRRSNPHVKALFTSGYPADLIRKEGVLEQGLHFLSKPSSPQALLRKVREVLDQ